VCSVFSSSNQSLLHHIVLSFFSILPQQELLKRLLLIQRETKGGVPGYLYRKTPATISQVLAASLAASPATLPADVLPHSRLRWIWRDAPRMCDLPVMNTRVLGDLWRIWPRYLCLISSGIASNSLRSCLRSEPSIFVEDCASREAKS